jgi:hypothetical protein
VRDHRHGAAIRAAVAQMRGVLRDARQAVRGETLRLGVDEGIGGVARHRFRRARPHERAQGEVAQLGDA